MFRSQKALHWRRAVPPFSGRWLGAALWVALLTTQVTPAKAQTEAPAEANTDDQARVLYLRGDRLYAEGRYEEAVEAFNEAFALSGRTALLFNVANAYERLGRLEEALAALQRFAPDAPEERRATVLARIQTLEERLRVQDEERRTEQAEAEAAEAEQAAREAAQPPEVDPNDAVADPLPPRPPESSSAVRPVGIAFMTVGALAVGGGVAAALLAGGSRDDLDSMCMDGVCPDGASGLIDEEKRRALAADILLIGGGTLLVTGLIMVLAAPSSSDDLAFDLQPSFDGVRAQLRTRF